jgi:hypothetical protein
MISTFHLIRSVRLNLTHRRTRMPDARQKASVWDPWDPRQNVGVWDFFFKPVLPALTNPPQQGSHAWHVLQTSVTMLTALIGAVVGNYLASRVERTERERRASTDEDV